ncbi:GNAT family N-acetyltransferase [Acinetobacter venetianus]|uniref:GNAT family N-acetyltransferase n=1 Tax=Acinetobacter venetianus TaxID=52133 RepID=UPI00077888EC|nr:GNAT family protein [Acinetobacter venetianus]KXZ67792.1 putative ribosomal N-acetyltransferase YdaF [Acinetobacter venetianus]
MTPFPILSTERLLLREIVMDDAPQLFEIYSNAEAMRWFGADPIRSISEAQKYVQIFADWRTHPNPATRWGIQTQESDQLIGTCGLFKWEPDWRKCRIGYELSSSAWGNGYMTEALKTMIAWGFAHMQLNRIEAFIHPKNYPSLRLAENLAFKYEGHHREAGYWSNQFHDLLHYGLLKSDWNSHSD